MSLFLWNNNFAAHIVGGEISYECLGNDQYRVTIEIYRDCNSTGAQFDNPMYLFVYDGVTNQRIVGMEQSIYSPQITNLPVIFNNPCVTPPSNICTEKGVYEQIITLPPNANGYTIAYQRCCRGANVTNLVNPEAQGLTLSAFIPGTGSGITCNSSPKFSNYPPLVLCANQDLIFDHSATDPDGDSLVYEICAPYQGGDQADPQPNPASNPPFDFVNYETAYTSALPLGASANMQIDPVTGLLTATPQQLGLYAVGICVSEYRNGQLISTNRRDFLFRVTNCDVQLDAVITPQVDLPGFISVCQGLTINFANESYANSVSTSYHWDFGVPGITSDTSNLVNPTFTFPAEGVYDVTLILNPGLPCSDTTTEQFIVFEDFDINIANNGPQCITNNSFNFWAFGDINDSTTFTWDFGVNASLNFSTDSVVNGVMFNTSGYIPIVFTAQKEQCLATIHDTILIYQEPTIGFYMDDSLLCAPYTANFIDSCFATTPIYYDWDFGNGMTSTDANPTTIYTNPGTYDVSLTIYTDSGCIDTLTLLKVNYIEVFPSPIAGIDADKLIVDPYDPFVTFTEQCSNHSSFEIHVDTTVSFTSPYVYGFIESGDHFPYVVAYNQNGCTDTAFIHIYVNPSQTILIPNAFTPNGDGKNDQLFPIILDVLSFDFRIFNRYGKLIYESNTYGDKWDGTYKGNIVQDGVYVYQLKYVDMDKIPHELYGHITVLR
ncbi:MAG: gliding motility-associated C-terminal domain-containing protein [Crocinitomicaceae bacterium]|nr:gliding motility-associated C-terminal domain-containing protein [Crocinitomicaceae bacterium]